MNRRRLVLLLSTGALLLASCSTSTTDEHVVTPVDIKDIVLTNLSGDCADYASPYEADVQDLQQKIDFLATFTVTDGGESCDITSNGIPNYDFNDESARFADPVAIQDLSLSIPRNPKKADEITELSLLYYNAVMLNGVVLDLLSNGCYMPEDAMADPNGNIANGCGLSVDWRLNPMGPVKFGTDSHNAHTQPGGLYHYHGNPMALYDPEETHQGSPVIGFAADGFPIYGPHYIDPVTGEMKQATSGYTLKRGARPTTEGSPGGTYDGTYNEDYEFTGAGTLDKCNGMTINGQYGYYVTATYPYVMGCFTGSPDKTFFKFWSIAKWIVAGVVLLLGLLVTLVVFVVRRRRRRNPLVTQESDKL